ncbi:hypothetical protein INR49_027211 [Caranx melampygus]|nr:hypothetical protein INR49_027211 [Caranx melampygus]
MCLRSRTSLMVDSWWHSSASQTLLLHSHLAQVGPRHASDIITTQQLQEKEEQEEVGEDEGEKKKNKVWR